MSSQIVLHYVDRFKPFSERSLFIAPSSVVDLGASRLRASREFCKYAEGPAQISESLPPKLYVSTRQAMPTLQESLVDDSFDPLE